MQLSVVADDLSGAAETAGAVSATDQQGRVRRRIRIALGGSGQQTDAEISVVDTGSRALDAASAATCAVGVVASTPAGVVRFLKYDSLLRGHLASDLVAVAAQTPVVLAPAVPALGRVVLDGVPRIDGATLVDSGLWALERRAAPARVLDLFPPGAAVGIALAEVRGPRLAERIGAARPGGPVICCDAVDEDDLARIAGAAWRAGALLAGSSSLAVALAELVLTAPPGPWAVPPLDDVATVTLVGSGSPRAAAQADHLERCGGRVLRLDLGGLEGLRLPVGDVTVLVREHRDPRAAPRILTALAATAAQAGDRHLVLSGGQTARAVLDACGVRSLTPLLVPHLGAVVSTTEDRRLVVTRPGSFGPDSSLVDIRHVIAHLVRTSPEVIS